ncbi:hypothetical protein FRC19_009875 [Serendipita sp. 401]|nr:hypothetical protein FRC15_002998 [Serendipita sp. 397]KAG8819301.1 hypothetical protein FRC19_009875 [Serendipita sp. 401]KAG9052866.1 hypothetical protein FS842_009119 [Serendipita sp. 407]
MPLRIIVPDSSPPVQKDNGPPNLYYRQLRAPMSEEDVLMLRQMRLASGTYYDRIPTWLEEMALGHRLMWFIYLSPPTAASNPQAPPSRHNSRGDPLAPASASSPVSPGSLSFILNNDSVLPKQASPESSPTSPSSHHHHHGNHSNVSHPPPIAMVCLLTSNPSDPSLASPQTARFELTSLWIYPLYRSHGIGVSIIKQMEYEAALRGAEYLTFNTSAGYGDGNNSYEAGGNGNGSPTAATHHNHQTFKTFERMGYCEYKPREHRYSVNDVVNAGLPVQSTLAAFFEKYVGQRRHIHNHHQHASAAAAAAAGRQHAHAHTTQHHPHAHPHAPHHNHNIHAQPSRRQGSIGERLTNGERIAIKFEAE